jgi:hypothetical protein
MNSCSKCNTTSCTIVDSNCSTTCTLNPCDSNYCYYVEIAKQAGIIISPCFDTSKLSPVSVIIFLDNFCSTIYKHSSSCSPQQYTIIITGTNSLPIVKKYLENNPNLSATNVLAKITSLKALILIQLPIESIYTDIGLVSTSNGTQIVVDSNLTSQQTLILYEQFIASLLNNTPNIITHIVNDLSTGLISNKIGCCIQQLIKALACFPFSKALFAFLATRNLFLNQSIQPFMFAGANNKFIVNIQNFPGTLFIDQTTTVNLQSGCCPSCPLIYSSTTNRYFVTNSCSLPFLQQYYTKLFSPGRVELANFISSLSSFLFIIDIGSFELPNGTTISLVINIASTGIFYYTSSDIVNIAIKVLLTNLDKYLQYSIKNGIPSGLIDRLSTIANLLSLLNAFATDDCGKSLLTYLDLFLKSLISFLSFPSLTNLGLVVENLLTLLTFLKNNDIISNYQKYNKIVKTFPVATTILSYLLTLRGEFSCKGYSSCEKIVIALIYYVSSFGFAPPPTNTNLLFISGSSLINSTTTSGTIGKLSISLVPNIAGTVYDPNTNYLYAVSSSNANLYIFNATTGESLKTIPLSPEIISGYTTQYNVEYSNGIAGASYLSFFTSSGVAPNFLVKVSVVASNTIGRVTSTKYFISEYTISLSLSVTQGAPLYTPSFGTEALQAEINYGLLTLETSKILLAQVFKTGVINLFALGQTIPYLINLPAEPGQFVLNKNIFYAPLPSLDQYVYYDITKLSTFPLTIDGTIDLDFSPVAMTSGVGQDSTSLYIFSSTGVVYNYDSTCNTLVSSFQSSLTDANTPQFILTNETGLL